MSAPRFRSGGEQFGRHSRTPARSASEKNRSVARPRRAVARGARRAARAAAADHPCRRHQWQRFDHRLHARDPRSGGQERPCLYLAASRALSRAHPARAEGRRQTCRRCRTRRGAVRIARRSMPAQPITFFEITTAAAFKLFSEQSGRLSPAGSRPRRPCRCDQCRRAAGGDSDHAGLDRSSGISRLDGRRDRL